jgi:leucine dehydrogenase
LNLETLLQSWAGESVIVQYDQETGAWIFIAIFSTRLGPAAGGTRMRSYPDVASALKDAMRLSEGMAYKWAVPNLSYGGGKAVISTPAELNPNARAGLLRRYGQLVHQLGGLFVTGPDVGTNSADMDIIAETGSPHIFGRSEAAGGTGSSGPATALGVFLGLQVTCEYQFGSTSLEGKRVLVQGAGSVGGGLIKHLLAAGAQVSFSDINPEAISHYHDELNLPFIPPDEVYSAECDVFAPCALGGVLSAETIPLLKCKVVAGGANNQLVEPADAELLQARGILYAPDYIINAGGAMFLTYLGTKGWTREKAEQEMTQSIPRALKQVFYRAAVEGISTEAAGRRIAEARLNG